MAAQSLNPWIADLIREEINAVLAWQTSKYDNIKVRVVLFAAATCSTSASDRYFRWKKTAASTTMAAISEA